MRKPLIERVHPAGMGGVQKVYRFSNGYGASVIKTPFSYGGSEGKWELGVIKFNSEDNDDWRLDYEHPEAQGDIRGYLMPSEVEEILTKIENTENEQERL